MLVKAMAVAEGRQRTRITGVEQQQQEQRYDSVHHMTTSWRFHRRHRRLAGPHCGNGDTGE